MKSKKQKLTIREYDCLRVIATLLVVIGHCTYFAIISDWGGVDYSALISEPSLLFKLFDKITQVIYLFHMPLFMALSGALFHLTFKGGKYATLGKLIADKAKRLLIPFLVVGICYSFPLKLLSGYYSNCTNVLRDLFMGQILIQGNTHLWYCATLFAIFVLAYVLEKALGNAKWAKIPFLATAFFLSSQIKINLISYVFEYTLWFYLGYCFEPAREKINAAIDRNRRLPIKCFIAGAFLWVGYQLLDGQAGLLFMALKIGIKPILTAAMCCCAYIVAYILSKTPILEKKGFKLLLKDSFGIYLYSDPLNYVLLLIFTSLLDGVVFNTNFGALLLYAVRIVISLGASILVTELLRKLRVKYLY